jgi:transposase
MLMEQLDYSLLFRWFVGLNMDDSAWDVMVFTKNSERLADGDIAQARSCVENISSAKSAPVSIPHLPIRR